MNRVTSLKAFVLILSLYLSMTATSLLAATSIEIYQAKYTSETNTLDLIGANFDNFGLPVVSIGDTLLQDSCSIPSPTLIECDIKNTPAITGGTFPVRISAGNSPHTNAKIDVYIPPSTQVIQCNPGDLFICYSDLPSTINVGECQSGYRICGDDGHWGECLGAVTPVDETCEDGLDNDCDGEIDEGCSICGDGIIQLGEVCDDGNTDACGTCNADCTSTGQGGDCGTGVGCIDNSDCLSGACLSGVCLECSPGQLSTLQCGYSDVGICQFGTQTRTCDENGQWGNYGSCLGQIIPTYETCDGLDNDCDGAVDEGNPSGSEPCSTGLNGVCGVGYSMCAAGELQCVQNHFPTTEICDGLDNDCDGQTDEDGVCIADDSYEPNDLSGSARFIGDLNQGQTRIFNNLTMNDNSDWYKFNAIEGSSTCLPGWSQPYRIIIGINFSHADGDLDLKAIINGATYTSISTTDNEIILYNFEGTCSIDDSINNILIQVFSSTKNPSYSLSLSFTEN